MNCLVLSRRWSWKCSLVHSWPCAPPAARVVLPKMQWLSDSALQIAYAPDPSAPAKEKPLMKALDASKFVHVTFVAGK